MYPSVLSEDNVAPNTQIGKIEIEETVYKGENAYGIEATKYSRGGEFIENMITDNFITFAHRWFHLANMNELISDIDEFFASKGFGNYSGLVYTGFMNNTLHQPIVPTASGIRNPIRTNALGIKSPVIFYTERNKEYNFENLSNMKGL